MQTQDFTYHKGDNGEPLSALVHWSQASPTSDETSKPIVIIFHGGGFTVGSNATTPLSQISHLTTLNFVVVVPNYRLCPQISALDGAFADAASAMTWCRNELPALLQSSHDIVVDGARIAAMGYSAGGTLALHLATQPSPPRAVAAFYPSLYTSDPTSSAHKPYSGFGPPIDFDPTTPEHLSAVSPEGFQVSSFPFAAPGQPRQPRHEWFISQLQRGTLFRSLQPDGDFAAIDPCTQFARKASTWPPTVFVQGDKDDAPGSGLGLAERAVAELHAGGAEHVELKRVSGAAHMFDMMPGATVGSEGSGAKVKEALDFLRAWVSR